ncbi:hypothetical protein LZD49_28635 [Dyadobacter sp. CY261]|uniref:hypothetical protein n=1 Tax=Dyadobacter sp. CY261 TaxID=2907203 RepID=UPI001F205B49|nr:hypothetical protein [Dyadobacter sp. CY261]MCF0074486.1 hypothetical protein [Dyadobacter sp. CY261]
MSNQPAKLWSSPIFRENPFPVEIDFESAGSITTPVTVELWSNEAFFEIIPCTVVDDKISFVITVPQLRAVNARKSAVYIKEAGITTYYGPVIVTLDGAVSQPQTFTITAPSAGTIRVTTYSDAATKAVIDEALAQIADNLQEIEDIKQQIIEYGESGRTYLGIWDASVNVPALSTAVPVAGSYYKIGVPGTQNITGAPKFYPEGAFVISNGTVWQLDETGSIVADGSVTVAKLESKLQALNGTLPDNSEYVWVVLDSEDKKLFAVRKSDGGIEGVFDLQTGAVTSDKLADDIKGAVGEAFDNTNSEFILLVVDPDDKKIYGVKKSGAFYIAKPDFAPESIPTYALKAEVTDNLWSDARIRVNESNSFDRAPGEADGLIRANRVSTGSNSETLGYRFAELPRFNTPYVFGENTSGTDLEFIDNKRMVIEGRRYRGDFDPTASAYQGSNYRGTYGIYPSSYPALPAGVAGDCWIIMGNTAGGNTTAQGHTFKNGDSLVNTGVVYVIQSGPGDGTFQPGDFWNITASGWFCGKYYKVGERIIFNTYEVHGTANHAQYLPSKPGQFFLMGECDPATFGTPASPKEGDVYPVLAAGSWNSFALEIGDHVFRVGSSWGVNKGNRKVVAAGQAFFFECHGNASSISFRRVDKSNTQVSIPVYGEAAMLRRKTSDLINGRSDSMLETGGTGNKVRALLPTERDFDTTAYGSGFPQHVFGMWKQEIRSGDINGDRTLLIWTGRNGFSQTDAAMYNLQNQIFNFYSTLGTLQKRVWFMSVLPQRTFTFNGTRLVGDQMEGAFNGTDNHAKMEAFFSALFPDQWISPYKILLDKSKLLTDPDPFNPGKTKGESATELGWIASDYYNLPVLTGLNNSLGYWSTAGLPSNGSGANGDYYLRSGNGTIGNIIRKASNVWAEFATGNNDVTHPSSDLGSTALSEGIVNIINTQNK